MKSTIRHLSTLAGEKLTDIPWNTYPRPQLKRSEWECLNGVWDFEVGNAFSPPAVYSEKILLPFCPESLLSGINRRMPENAFCCYRRQLQIPQDWEGKRILLHFGAVDQRCRVYLDHSLICSHEGGYLPFTVELKDLKPSASYSLEVIAQDTLDHTFGWGKQSNNRGGMWYTPVSGIWQTIWMEPVNAEYISDLEIQTHDNTVDFHISGAEQAMLIFGGKTYSITNSYLHLEIEQPKFWSPENPYLYYFQIKTATDEVESYFALRTLSIETLNGKKRLCLNGKPYFFHGLLDQGYWSDGIYTPATPQCYEDDILAMKSLGFNTLRKHIKVEAEQFYYDCDRFGMIVFQDMVNSGDYHFLRDTALPTIGIQKLSDRNFQPNHLARSAFLSSMRETVQHLFNHPCICCWTIFNEGWGQFCADEAYDTLKKLDSSRFIDSTSGWFHQKKSDVDSLHIYFRKLKLDRDEKAQVISEFGGYSYKITDHSANPTQTYGYRKYTDREHFLAGLRKLYLEEVLPLVPKGLCGAIYTQVSDVEDETNGFLTYDRKILKVQPKDFSDIGMRLSEAIDHSVKQ